MDSLLTLVFIAYVFFNPGRSIRFSSASAFWVVVNPTPLLFADYVPLIVYVCLVEATYQYVLADRRMRKMRG